MNFHLWTEKMASSIPTSLIISFSCNPFPSTFSATKIRYPVGPSSWVLRSGGRKHGHVFVGSLQAAISGRAEGCFDPELRSVLELATDSELYELERILFGPSYFSPLIKSFTNGAENDYIVLGEDYEERQYFTEILESRFLFLAADARSTLRGWRPTYRDVLLDVRRKLRVPCSSKLSTEDLEVEIFLHLLQDYSSHESGIIPCSLESSKISRSHGSLELGLSQWKVQVFAAVKVGAGELQSTFLKGGGVLTLAKIFQLLARGLSGKLLLEAANYQIKHELVKKGGRMAALNLESRVALLAAKQGFAGAASRYLGLRSMMMLLGPMLWGTLLADVVIQMLGTDYARILRAIYAFAQIRIIRTYR
ncbi:hypothetical protein NE237_005721 [Protea cynaroides]|uniref:Uncharacterized protein n=1 Tax=Protea cynaroides TaxID=273540 RepID=A0A9Q0KL11_9MAGN|nr:hypothetical protein NE237_005721 [Protea cynaroides]